MARMAAWSRLQFALGALLLVQPGCAARRAPDPDVSPSTTPAPGPEVPATPEPEASAAPEPSPASQRRPFDFGRIVIAGSEAIDGPGVRSLAAEGRAISTFATDGSVHPATVTAVEPCEEDENDACYVAIESTEEDDGYDDPSPPWVYPGALVGRHDLDLAVPDVALAGPADMTPPVAVAHSIEVYYAHALCEADEDDQDYVLVRDYTTNGVDPIAGFAGFDRTRRFPMRVVTLEVGSRTFHFVTVSKLRPPRSNRMFDIPKRFEMEFYLLEAKGDGFAVRTHEVVDGGRDMNVDISCALPLRFPTPWTAIEVDGTVWVLTREGLSTYARWAVRADGLVRDAPWEANVVQLG